ncbi:MAG TPA: prephenate dehydrogenase/arogenate dehydrogenase family protein [Bryobacteraceae bacterium]|nr:prephenate dehydrogenase/arogenate dehydrogenase family protein [Bryobacteraceae bacterium]
MQNVAIVGVGLIGASFGLALRKAGFEGEIAGVSSPSAIADGLACGAISSEATLEQAARRADLIYLAQPVNRILETIEILGPLARAGCLVTDAGSTKVQIVERALLHLRSATFLGGHPLAGKEQRGAAAAEADLFRSRPYVLTPVSRETPATQEFREWLARLGAKVLDTSPQEHDQTVALTSHLPQLVSTALSVTLAQRNTDALRKIFGPGLIDMTRLSLSAPDLWLSIFSSNKLEILRAIDEFVSSLNLTRHAIEADDISNIFHTASKFAASIRNPTPDF